MGNVTDHFPEFASKMRAAGLTEACIRAFEHNYRALVAGATGQIPEADLEPVLALPRYEALPATEARAELLRQTVVLKLNGGLGTSMGLESPKSLLRVRDGQTFLDLIARQILHLRRTHGVPLRFLLMNSFSTSAATLAALTRHPELGEPKSLELLQNFVPKVDLATLRPVEWPAHPQLEWCPPGHGDLFPALAGSGWLERLLADGARYLFVSNADNLGASLDPKLLAWFAASGSPFLMEVCERTAADRKGGHLAQRRGQLLLRESAQCPAADEAAFQDITRHRYFNTNNLWVRLDALADVLRQHGGMIPLPLIKNVKTVDPRDPRSPKVAQLETAMGAAIECFPGAAALLVPRARFAPVKTCADLLAVRSDAYRLTPDWRIELVPERHGQPPALDLDGHYKLVDQLEAALADGVPSLRDCRSLAVKGPVRFSAANVFRGNVRIVNPATAPRPVPAGVHADTELTLPS